MAEPLYLNITGNLSVNGCCVWFCTRRWNEAIGKANPTRNLEPALLKRQGSACPDLRPTACMWPHDPQKRLYPEVNNVQAGATPPARFLGCFFSQSVTVSKGRDVVVL